MSVDGELLLAFLLGDELRHWCCCVVRNDCCRCVWGRLFGKLIDKKKLELEAEQHHIVWEDPMHGRR